MPFSSKHEKTKKAYPPPEATHKRCSSFKAQIFQGEQMKKALAILFILSLTLNAYAATRPIALPLEHYLRDLNKFEGADVRTKMQGSEYVIGYWDANGVAKPNAGELETIIDDYEQYLIDQAQLVEDDKVKTKSKLGMTDKQFEELQRALGL